MNMATIKNLPPQFTDSGDDNERKDKDTVNTLLINLLQELLLNKNLFTINFSDEDDKEILDLYGYRIHRTTVKLDEIEGEVSVALPSNLSDTEVESILDNIRTIDDSMEYYPKVVLEQENKKLYKKLIKKWINDCNSN